MHQLCLEQKERTQEAVKEALWAHEKKAKEAKEDRNKIFKNIDRLRGKKNIQDIQIYSEEGVKLTKEETEREIKKILGRNYL